MTSSTNSSTCSSTSHKATSCAFVAFRVGGGLLLLTFFLASLANPYPPAHPRAAVKAKTGGDVHTNTKARRDTQRFGFTANSTALSFDPIDLVLPQFPTLQTALDTSEVVVLYFGASWCKQSAPVTTMIDQVLGPKLQAQAIAAANSNNKKKKRQNLSVVYVSSDSNRNQYRNYNRNRFWSKVPFQKSAERKLLKKHFSVCAKREMDKLQIQRQYAIPHMIVLSGKNHKVVTRTGVEDLKLFGPGVLEYWTKLVRGKIAISK